MFVKLLAVSFSNVFVSFWCLSVLHVIDIKVRFKGGNKQMEQKFLGSAIEHTDAMIQAQMHSSTSGRNRAHVHVNCNPSAIVKSLENLCALERTLSAIERTRADLAMQKPQFFIIYSILFSCNLMEGWAVESKNTTFVVRKPFQMLFYCKFRFLMISMDIIMFFVVMRG